MDCFDLSKFFLDEKMGFNRIFRWFDRVLDQDSARACSPVFESNQFSFVPNRKGNIFRQDVHSVNRSRVVFLWRVFLVSNFPRNQPRGRDLFWIYALDFRRVFACFVVHEGLYRILFKLLMNGGRLVWVPRPLRPNGSRTKKPENERDGRVVDVRNNFSYARSGTSFQWWTRRRWLVRKLKICKFSLVSKICYFFGSLSCVSCFLDGWKGGTRGDAESIFLRSKVGWIFLFCLVWWLEVTSLFWILNNFCFGICCFWRGRVARFRQGF